MSIHNFMVNKIVVDSDAQVRLMEVLDALYEAYLFIDKYVEPDELAPKIEMDAVKADILDATVSITSVSVFINNRETNS